MREWELHLGDALGVLPGMPDGSVDAVVTDPPYGLVEPRSGGDGTGRAFAPRTDESRRKRRGGFMGKAWDAEVPGPEVWAECLRVVKPGAYLLAFGGTRTHHRMMCAVEDAGWELTDTLCWLHGQGFPKGKGCLKPAWEPIVLARKAAHRVLPLNIDECRIPIVGPVDPQRQGYSTPGKGASRNCYALPGNGQAAEVPHPDSPRHDARGRWPANLTLSHHESCVCRGTKRVPGNGREDKGERHGSVYGNGKGPSGTGGPRGVAGPDGTEEVEDWECHPECPVFLLDSQAGERNSGGPQSGKRYAGQPGGWAGGPRTVSGYTDGGNASRFFATFPSPLLDVCEDSSKMMGVPSEENPCRENGQPGGVSGRVTAGGTGGGGSLEAENSTPSSNPAGSGSKRTARSRRATRSTTKTTTAPTTGLTTSASSPPSGTTTTTSDSGKITGSLTGSSNVGASGARNTAPSGSLTHGQPELSRATATGAAPNTCASGEHETGSTTTPTCENGADGIKNSKPPTTESTAGSGKLREMLDANSPPRFFYVSKADRADRGEGNDHATVKPTALMSWLVKLVTRPGETVLDPFAGSGSTGVAALRCERRFVGVERDAHYHAIALKRLAAVDGPLFARPAGEAAP